MVRARASEELPEAPRPRGKRCFVDIFSWRVFAPDHAVAIALEHFGGTASVTVLTR